jgi:hydrogenase maturation protease
MTGQGTAPDVLVIGIGPSLRGDDSAGPMAVARWHGRSTLKNRPSVEVVCLEAPGLGLLDIMDGARKAVLVDAVRSGAPPGSLHCVSAEALAAFTSDSRSAHGWGVGETLALARLVCPERLPEDLTIVGIEIESLNSGQELSPAVASSLEGAADLIEDLVQGEPTPAQALST